MSSTPNAAEAGPNNAIAAAADERLKHAYQQIASADAQLARVTERLSKMEREDAHNAAPVRVRRAPQGGPALRGFIGLVLAGCIIGGAFLSQSPSGGLAGQLVNRWIAPVLASSVPRERARPEVGPSPVQVAAADATVVPAIASAPAPAPAPAQDAPAAAAPAAPELTQQLQAITRDIANLDQKIEQLRAAQEQLAIQMDRDTARSIGELKASQDQLMHLMARPSEPGARTRATSAPASASRQVAATARQPASTHGSPQAGSPATTRSPAQSQ